MIKNQRGTRKLEKTKKANNVNEQWTRFIDNKEMTEQTKMSVFKAIYGSICGLQRGLWTNLKKLQASLIIYWRRITWSDKIRSEVIRDELYIELI